MTDLGSLDYELKRDVSALCQMVEDDYPQAAVYRRYGVILSALSELVMINRRALPGQAPKTDRTRASEAAGRVRAWRRQDDANQRAWFERNEHPVPDPLWQPDEEVGCHFGCGTALLADDGTLLPLLLADLDALLEAVEMEVSK